MKKKILGILMSAVLTVGLVAGCGAKGNTADSAADTASGAAETEGSASAASGADEESQDVASGEKRELVFAYSVDNVDLSQQGYIDYCQLYVDYLNETRNDISVELKIMDGQSSVDKQISDVETAIAMKVDGIIISSVDPVGLTPICKEAMDAGIPVLDWRDMGRFCTVTLDVGNELGKGELAVQWFRDYMDANPDKNLKVGLQRGAPAQTQQYARFEPFAGLAEEYPEQFEIVVEQYGDWGTDTSMKITEDWLQAYDLNCIVSANEEMMIGVSEVLKGAGVLDDYLLTTYNGEEAGQKMLAEGTIAMDVGTIQSIGSPLIIEHAINMVMDGLTGYFDLSEDVLVTVTPENLEEYKAKTTDPDYSQNIFESTLKDSYQ